MILKASDLGQLQIVVLRALWSLGEGTVYEVRDALPRQVAPAYTTVLTVLRSLEKRGLVEHYTPSGERQHRYRPLVSEGEAERGVLCDVLDRVFDGSAERLLARLIETGQVGLPEIAAAHRLLEEGAQHPCAAPERAGVESRKSKVESRKSAQEQSPGSNGSGRVSEEDSVTDLSEWRRKIARKLR
jgi:BlaI family penicillinase repressor